MTSISNPCQAVACALQECISRNTYKPEKCDSHLRELYSCCLKMYEKRTGEESTACPIESVVKRWMVDHPEADSKS